uniref:Uncharacterized protein n=1 Tax=Oryza nivara TaxID=4536 RepID=A0A0E0I8G6_ORYNI
MVAFTFEAKTCLGPKQRIGCSPSAWLDPRNSGRHRSKEGSEYESSIWQKKPPPTTLTLPFQTAKKPPWELYAFHGDVRVVSNPDVKLLVPDDDLRASCIVEVGVAGLASRAGEQTEIG